MVKVNYFVKNDKIEKVILNGHSNYDDYGKDIVCASISAIVITTVNACLKIDKDSIKHSEDKDVIITILKHSDVIDKLINNMIDLLTELSKQYENKGEKRNEKIRMSCTRSGAGSRRTGRLRKEGIRQCFDRRLDLDGKGDRRPR